MAALQEGAQSLWYPYVQKKIVRENDDGGSKSGINCNTVRLKNGELLLAVAKCVMVDGSVTLEDMSSELGITKRSVKSALKKIRDKLSLGLAIPGLNDMETENLALALSKRDSLRNKRKRVSGHIDEEAKARKERIISIAREFAIEKMIRAGNSVAETASVVGLSGKRIREILAEMYFTTGVLAKEIIQSGGSVSEASERLGVTRKEVKQALLEVGYHIITDDAAVTNNECSKVSMMKPGKPRKREYKKPATISKAGLAEWNMMHYDQEGILRLPAGCRAPADLPRKYPSPKANLLPAAETKPTWIPAPPLSKSECTARGRKRIGYLRLY
ncbi:hypothetical protein Psch_03547 [Pelotomaculum schinkii]|uniref:Uncharacterized protein n=1 Tax=Pelotomaculum schinkii TaxID=78350 RepID=A0A4Y7R776_9FIRM|nr:hypothetical protein [Pelotomaculum schinkii]TEB04785.1 hypothetical protein Psch_03547 [Pelotomaculum schinkii]